MTDKKLKKGDSAQARVMNMVLSQIRSEKLQPGDRLLPIRELSKVAGVGIFSVQRAIAELTRQGVIEAHRGRGIFVSQRYRGWWEDGRGEQAAALTRLAVCNAFAKTAEGFQVEHPGTVSGILSACEEMSIKGQLLTPSDHMLRPNALLEELNSGGYQGVVWLYPEQENVAVLQELDRSGVAVVMTSHTNLDAPLARVQDDHTRAQTEAARYLLGRDCRRIVQVTIRHSSGPNGGEVQDPTHRPHFLPFDELGQMGAIEMLDMHYGEANVARMLQQKLAESTAKTAVLIPNAHCCRHFLRHRFKEAAEILADSELVVSTPETPLEELKPLSELLDFSVSVHPLEAIGKLAVHKLLNIAQGAFKETITLVPVKFGRIREMLEE